MSPVDSTDISERAEAILREEIATGALANIVESKRIWSTSRPDRVAADVLHQLRPDLESVAAAVLELLRPSSRHVAQLRLPGPVQRGDTTTFRTRLANDTPNPAELHVTCSDLVGDTGGCMRASCVNIAPQPVHVPAGRQAEVALTVSIPADLRRGVYRAVVEVVGRPDIRAVLLLPVV